MAAPTTAFGMSSFDSIGIDLRTQPPMNSAMIAMMSV